MKNNWLHFIALFILAIPLIISCNKEATETNGSVVFIFDHKVNGDPVVPNQMKYINAAGNHYEVTNIQWFLSNVTFYRKNQTPVVFVIAGNPAFGVHYVDTDIPSTWTWSPDFKIPEGDYDSISFVFGLDSMTNQSGLFRNNPEAAMFWPDIMGGGYHYMKFNGYWMDTNNVKKAFNYHLGIGQIYGADTTFVQNYFVVNLNPISFHIDNAQTKEIQIVMNIEHWFTNPVFDFNHWGGSIMDKQPAILAGCLNGRHVFSINYIKDK